MKDIPGTITDRFTILLTDYFDIGEVLINEYRKSLLIEKQISHRDMIGLEYRVAVLITDSEELRVAMSHYNFLHKYQLV